MPADPMRLTEPKPFGFGALAAWAGTAPLGGPRETGLAVLMVCRVAAEATDGGAIDADARRERAQAARQWLGTLALPVAVRTASARAIDATIDPVPDLLGAALLQVIAAAGAPLDEAALADVRRLVTRVTG